MIVTVNKKEVPTPEFIRWQDLPGGTVVEFVGGAIGLVYEGAYSKSKGVAMLTGCNKPTIADGYLEYNITKVLGILTECIVEEN